MYKVQVDVPATVTNLGLGIRTLGMALNLHSHIEMIVRPDGELSIGVEGEDADDIPTDFSNPVLRSATRLFQHLETAPVGLDIHIVNHIPLGVGLDADAALLIGGLIAANNLTDFELSRDDLIEFAAMLGLRKVDALTTLMGGLTISTTDAHGEHLYRSLEPPPLKMVVMTPEIPDYAENTQDALPQQVPLEAAIANMGRLPFMLDAMMDGDFDMLARTMQDELFQDAYTQHITGYADAVQAALDNGAACVSLASNGPTLMVFSPVNHASIAEDMVTAFNDAGVEQVRHWLLGIDAQGVVVSVVS